MFPQNSRNALVGFDSCRGTSVTSKGVLLGGEEPLRGGGEL
jgi:hypothetical protein